MAVGIALSWAGFHGERVDGVALLGGVLFVCGGFGLFIGTIQAARVRTR
jgi:hypothetical protein